MSEIKRIQEILGTDDAKEIAKSFDVSISVYYSWAKKSRQKIPIQYLINFCLSSGVSLDWILLGRGSKYAQSTKDLTIDSVKNNQLEDHIAEKEIEILEAFRSLPKERQAAFYHKIKYEAIEYGEQNALKAV